MIAGRCDNLEILRHFEHCLEDENLNHHAAEVYIVTTHEVIWQNENCVIIHAGNYEEGDILAIDTSKHIVLTACAYTRSENEILRSQNICEVMLWHTEDQDNYMFLIDKILLEFLHKKFEFVVSSNRLTDYGFELW